tara:strand:- start:93 stop:311 length:219 start_codon:yes stop_codon:yes gene_type:complete
VNKMTEEDKTDIKQVLGTVLQMIQYMQQVTSIEAARILHDNGWCKEYIDDCPICKEEELKKKEQEKSGDEEE